MATNVCSSRNRYEHLVPEDTVVALNQLCHTCARFTESSLLRKLFRRVDVRIGTSESIGLCSPEQLKSGYLKGCHLCALIWDPAGGHLFDPSKPTIPETQIVLRLKARNPSKEYTMETEGHVAQLWWWKLAPPFIGERGVIVIQIPAVLKYEARLADLKNDKLRNLYVYQSLNPDLNRMTLSTICSPVSSKHEMELAQIDTWYHECLKTHAKCRELPRLVAPMEQLPSRLLDLLGDKIRLECAVQDLPELQYTTLSHMWGPDPKTCLCLKKANLEDFQSEIPPAQMPAKYIDAIRITKVLGFRYLWIDSLCIIQDSLEDWEKEALKMAAVYGRTSFNISYIFPTSNEAAKKHLRDPRVNLPCKMRQEPLQQEGLRSFRRLISTQTPSLPSSLVVQHVPGFMSAFWSPGTYKEVWPLLSRAWVFQERLLCPRNVYYGHSQLMWECCEKVNDEFCGELPNSSRSKGRYHAIFAGLADQRQDFKVGEWDPTFKAQWHLLVQDYRTKSLTYENDRIIAFAGIANAIQAHNKFTYLAGIWKEFAELGLLWCISPPIQAEEFRQKMDQQRKPTPSWSWFSIPTHFMSSGNDLVDFRIYENMYLRSKHTLYQARVTSFNHPKLDSNPDSLLHDFDGLNITLSTRRVLSKLEWGSGGSIGISPIGHYDLWEDNWIDTKDRTQYLHDDVSLVPGSKLPTETSMILTTLEAWRGMRGGGK